MNEKQKNFLAITLSLMFDIEIHDIENVVSYTEHIVLKSKGLKTLVKDSGLSVRAINLLHEHKIYTVGDITKLTEADLLKWRNLGKLTLSEIENKLNEFGLRLRGYHENYE